MTPPVPSGFSVPVAPEAQACQRCAVFSSGLGRCLLQSRQVDAFDARAHPVVGQELDPGTFERGLDRLQIVGCGNRATRLKIPDGAASNVSGISELPWPNG